VVGKVGAVSAVHLAPERPDVEFHQLESRVLQLGGNTGKESLEDIFEALNLPGRLF